MALINDGAGRNTEVGQKQLNIDNLFANEAAKVMITGGSNRVEAVMSGDFGFSIGTEYTSLFDVKSLDEASTIVNSVSTVANSLQHIGAVKKLGFKGIPQVRLKTPGLTTKQFLGSKSPIFSLDIILMNIREDDDIMEDLEALANMSMPTVPPITIPKFGFLPKSIDLPGIYVAPLGYRGDAIRSTSTGFINVQIGGWFRAMHQIISDVSFSFSRIGSDIKGTPLICTANIKFMPTIDIGVGEFLDYFPR
jgi:hypothetical protein